MNRINIKKMRAARRREIVQKVWNILQYIVIPIILVFMIWAYVWLMWIFFGD